MEAANLASIVMQMISGLATSAGTSVGTAAGEEVSRLVRDRLGGSQEGRAALAQLDQEPGSADAESHVRTALTSALTEDPDFASRLEAAATQTALHAGRDVTVQTVSVSSSTVKGTINIGPLTITKSRGAYLALGAVVIVLALFVALGAYGTVQVISINDSPATPRRASTATPQAGNGPRLEPIMTKDVAKAVMPDQSALPAGWSAADEPDVVTASEARYPVQPGAPLFEGSIELTGPAYGITVGWISSIPQPRPRRSSTARTSSQGGKSIRTVSLWPCRRLVTTGLPLSITPRPPMWRAWSLRLGLARSRANWR